MKQRKYTAVIIIAVAVIAALAVAAIAHEGHGEPAMGTIAKVEESALSLTTGGDETITFGITEDTVFKRGEQEVGREGAQPGQRAVVRYEEHDGRKVAHEVLLPPAGEASGGSGDNPETAQPDLASASSPAALQPVERRFVCMVNDSVFERAQIPVEVDGKTYYGCCPMCKERLSAEAAARTAIDPISGNPVDKATAVIAARPDGTVLYFESEETLKHYSQ
jgi:YHS domain-containing protein